MATSTRRPDRGQAWMPLVAWLALGVAACGGGSGGTTTLPPPVPADISGAWNLTFTNMAGGGLSCNTSAIAVTIVQSSATFTGSGQTAWTLTCVSGGTTQSSTDTAATITNGTINGNTVRFSLATSASSQTGTLTGNTIAGTASWTVNVGTGVVTLGGQFSMTR
ncbi:MAG TPA: hypothetical protein VID74_03935 [Gemmatimonadales bacterium]|jgi:hypothetical protein